MESIRKPTPLEEGLLEYLIQRSSVAIQPDWKINLMVSPMDDGGMGSLLLYPNGKTDDKRLFGQQVSDFQFKDEDEIVVIASLNLDKAGNLFELDIWKTDYTSLIRIPLIS
jgi:hypothetical protein